MKGIIMEVKITSVVHDGDLKDQPVPEKPFQAALDVVALVRQYVLLRLKPLNIQCSLDISFTGSNQEVEMHVMITLSDGKVSRGKEECGRWKEGYQFKTSGFVVILQGAIDECVSTMSPSNQAKAA